MNAPLHIIRALVGVAVMAFGSDLWAKNHASEHGRQATPTPQSSKQPAIRIVPVYMIHGLHQVVTGSAAVCDESFSPYDLIYHGQVEDARLRMVIYNEEGCRDIPLPKDIGKLFTGFTPQHPHSSLEPWSSLCPIEDINGEKWISFSVLNDGKLYLVLPGENDEFSIPDETGVTESVTPFPQDGVLAVVRVGILKKGGNSTLLDGKYSLAGIDAKTHQILWSFPSANNELECGNLMWINNRYLLWTCHARHWEAFEVYDIKQQSVVANGRHSDSESPAKLESAKYNVINWRIENGKVLEYYYEDREPKVVFDSKPVRPRRSKEAGAEAVKR
jgi:hypothetical protein